MNDNPAPLRRCPERPASAGAHAMVFAATGDGRFHLLQVTSLPGRKDLLSAVPTTLSALPAPAWRRHLSAACASRQTVQGGGLSGPD